MATASRTTPAARSGESQSGETLRAEQLAEGVYALVQPEGGWCVNNAGLVLGTDGSALLVDTFATERRTNALRDEVLRLAGRPPRALVNTHFHGDHTFGNWAFPEAMVIGHERTRALMREHGSHLASLWPDVCWGRIDLVPPQLTYRDAVTLHLGDVRAEIRHIGPAAHTCDDTVVWLPESRVLFAGDLVMSKVTPFCVMGSVTGSLDALRRLREWDPVAVVPGHGPVGGPELLDANTDYLTWLLDLAGRGLAAGLSPLELSRQSQLPERFAALVDPERLPANLHRAYADLSGAEPGALLDIAAIFGEMSDFNGGLPDCHA